MLAEMYCAQLTEIVSGSADQARADPGSGTLARRSLDHKGRIKQGAETKSWAGSALIWINPFARLAAGAFAAVAVLAIASPSLADPCKAIPDKGPMPDYLARGRKFSGAVAYVGDGDSLCVALGPGPMQWVEVRLADFYGPELSAPRASASASSVRWSSLKRHTQRRRSRPIQASAKSPITVVVHHCEAGGPR